MSVGGCLGALWAQEGGNIHFVIYILVLDIYSQQLGGICHLNQYIWVSGLRNVCFVIYYICVGFMLPTIYICLFQLGNIIFGMTGSQML